MATRVPNQRQNWRLPFLLGVVVVGLSLFLLFLATRTTPERTATESSSELQVAKLALQRGNYALAQEAAAAIERDATDWASAQFIAGEAATRLGHYEDAIRHYESVPQDGSPAATLAEFALGEVARDAGLLSRADEAFRRVLENDPEHVEAHVRMAFLCDVTGRRWEALPHFLFLVKHRAWKLDSLVLLGDLERPLEEIEYLEKCRRRAPDDPLVRLALATQAVTEGRTEDARTVLIELLRTRPDLVAGQAMLGELLIDRDDATFLTWHDRLPPDADANPDIWYVRGLWARRKGELPVAARCFWETVRRVPEHRRGTYQLGQVLVALGRKPGDEFSRRASQLYEVSLMLDRVLRSEGRDAEAMQLVTTHTELMGRCWEAAAWAETSLATLGQVGWAADVLRRVVPSLKPDLPRTIDSQNLALRYDLSSLPKFATLFHESRPTEESRQQAASSVAQIRFDLTPQARLDFVYDNGNAGNIGARQFEQTGGGVAVIDLDADGWSDLYFTQGSRWKIGDDHPSPSPGLVDRVFRNVDGERFADVTSAAGLENEGFGQGCSAGDYDNDGFQDLYVANVGQNRLCRNNGDGTFSEVTSAASIKGDDWTTSCVIVDLNADGAPDLFDVNYVTGSDIYTAVCEGFACSPKGFEGVPDRLHLSRGDGTFEWIPDATPTQNAKGLGVVAIDLYERGRPCLFIANDQVPNFLLRNVATDDARGVKFVEEGFLSGLAFDENGLPMACMGIAADDANGDGRMDFYVTNFKDEYNTLYLQDAEGLFVDGTSAAGLKAPSFPFVGWGTQFLDADLDGAPDIVLTNGHVDDYRRTGGQYHMRPQIFRNTGGGRFEELLATAAGTYFAKEYVGRGLARLDWNKDGRMDFAVSNIGDNASLVTNQSTGVGQFVNVILHATTTARDAIGAKVTVEVADEVADRRRWTKMLCAGDGYQASNERVLQFGLGNATGGALLRVEWPSGATTDVKDVPPGTTLHVIENVGWHALHVKPAAEQLAVR